MSTRSWRFCFSHVRRKQWCLMDTMVHDHPWTMHLRMQQYNLHLSMLTPVEAKLIWTYPICRDTYVWITVQALENTTKAIISSLFFGWKIQFCAVCKEWRKSSHAALHVPGLPLAALPASWFLGGKWDEVEVEMQGHVMSHHGNQWIFCWCPSKMSHGFGCRFWTHHFHRSLKDPMFIILAFRHSLKEIPIILSIVFYMPYIVIKVF